jgi:hypothetical protein
MEVQAIAALHAECVARRRNARRFGAAPAAAAP